MGLFVSGIKQKELFIYQSLVKLEEKTSSMEFVDRICLFCREWTRFVTNHSYIATDRIVFKFKNLVMLFL